MTIADFEQSIDDHVILVGCAWPDAASRNQIEKATPALTLFVCTRQTPPLAVSDHDGAKNPAV
jgi:hypothetical protein